MKNASPETPKKLKFSDPPVVAWSERCATCGHSRAHHIAIDGPCNVMHDKDFCKCDHFAPMRPSAVLAPVE